MQAATTQARRERKTMAIAATESTSLIAFTLPSTPYSVRMARFCVRAALGCHGLGDYTEDIETVTSELVSNAITHAGARPLGLELLRLEDGSGAVVVVVTDSCPLPPVKRDPTGTAEHGRGLLVVEALSAQWAWSARDPGKAVFAIFTRER
jgi:anti-sigma regulatory factor (Ser/Thr protein kinase)